MKKIMKTIKRPRPRFRQYLALHSNAIVAKDGVVIKVLDPFEIVVTCMLYNDNGAACLELCVRFKWAKDFMGAFDLDNVDEIKGVGRGEVLRVWRDQLLEEESVRLPRRASSMTMKKTNLKIKD
jgi:hypothetical protein